MPKKTRQAAAELAISYCRLMSLIRCDKVAPPAKDSSGDYLWTEADIAAAREALKVDRRFGPRPRKAVSA